MTLWPAPLPWGFWTWVKYYWFAWFLPSAQFEIRRPRRHPRRAFIHWSALSVRHQKWIALAIGTTALLSVFMYLFVMEKDFLGTTKQNEFIIFVELPAGAKLDISDQVVREVESKLSDDPNIANIIKTTAARVEGWSSKVYVTLAPRSERSRSVQDVINDVDHKVANIGQQFETRYLFFRAGIIQGIFYPTFSAQGPNVLRDLASAITSQAPECPRVDGHKTEVQPGWRLDSMSLKSEAISV